MGNSSSRSNSKSKASDRNAIRRRSFDAGGLSPGSSNHHRSRSMTPSFHMPEPHLAPPPPYSTEISKNPFLQPNNAPCPVGNFPHAGSQHTSFFADPQATAGPSIRHGRAYDIRTPVRQQTHEDALETLRKFDTVLIVDDSGSMNHQRRWSEARNALKALANLAGTYDTDGIDIHFLNSTRKGIGIKDEQDVQRLFDNVTPRGITPIQAKLEELLLAYLYSIEEASRYRDSAALKRIKPVNYIIITDGDATDDPESVIVQAARRLDMGNFPLSQVGIQFVQIGDDKKATAFLARLDDGLSTKNGIRDIVDTTPYTKDMRLTGDMLIKILLGGINRRVDRGGAGAIS